VDDRKLDEAIDRAVREMMDLEPQAGFRRRVLERVGQPRRGWLTVPRLAGAVAFAAAVIVFVLIGLDRQTAPPSAPAATIAGRPQAPAVVQPPAVQTPRSPATPPITRTRRRDDRLSSAGRGRTASAEVQAAAFMEDDIAIAPLETIHPLSIPAIAETRLTTNELAIDELRLAPLTIQPLPGGGADPVPLKDR
jgi:hypothetical protein